MNSPLFEKVWLAAVVAFMGYPLGDLLGHWNMEALIVLPCSVALLLAGRNVGKMKGYTNG